MIEILVMIYQVGALLIIINLSTIIVMIYHHYCHDIPGGSPIIINLTSIIVMIYRVGTLLIIINITTIMIYQVGILLI